MKNRRIRSIRTKLMAAFIVSAGAAVAGAFMMMTLAEKLYWKPFFHNFLRALRNHAGVQTLLFMTGLLFFVALFFLLTRKSLQNLQEIMAAVRRIEAGDLDTCVGVKTNDELGDLAAAINAMAHRLKVSMEEEKRAEQAKNDLITSVSHDLRTPLTSVIGFLGLLTDRRSRPEEELTHFAKTAHKKAIKLQGLIDELFEFTRVNYGGISLHTGRINIGELLEQLAEEYYPVFQEASMECRVALPPERIWITADGELVARLFENLFNNAVRYGREGRFVDVRVESGQGCAAIEVTNYGNPIPDSDLPHVFERFYRVESSRSRTTGGTGLGLAIARSVVELHGGSISVTSGPEGTCFKVTFPVKAEE